MQARTFVDNAKGMAKGQITIPKDVREVLGVSNGDCVSFLVDGSTSMRRSMQCRCCKVKWRAKRRARDSTRTGT